MNDTISLNFVSIDFDTLNKKPMMLKFESLTPKKTADEGGSWNNKFQIQYGSSNSERRPYNEQNKKTILKLSEPQNNVLENYIMKYFDSGI